MAVYIHVYARWVVGFQMDLLMIGRMKLFILSSSSVIYTRLFSSAAPRIAAAANAFRVNGFGRPGASSCYVMEVLPYMKAGPGSGLSSDGADSDASSNWQFIRTNRHGSSMSRRR